MNYCSIETVNACIMALIRRFSSAVNLCVARASRVLLAASAFTGLFNQHLIAGPMPHLHQA